MKLPSQISIPVASAVCLLILVVVLKNVLNVPVETLSRDIIIYIFIYSVFWILPSTRREVKDEYAKYWYLAIIITTLAIIGVYAL